MNEEELLKWILFLYLLIDAEKVEQGYLLSPSFYWERWDLNALWEKEK
jgi:hypothetical protein